MADFLSMDFSGIGSWFTSTSSSLVDTLWWLFIYACIGLLLWGCLYILSFKNLVRVRQHTASGYVIIDTKAREFSTKDGAKRWRLLRPKWIRQSIAAPPGNYLEFTSKGKFSVEADRTLDGVIVWRQRAGSPDTADAFTSEERTMTAMEMRRSDEYKREGWGKKLMDLAPTIMVVMILVLMIANWGDLVRTTTDGMKPGLDKLNSGIEKLDSTLNRLECAPSGNFSLRVDNRNNQEIPIPDRIPN